MKNLSALKQAIKDNSVSSSKDYFNLADDGDKAKVVFLHATEEDIDWGTVYEVQLPIEGEMKPDGTQKTIKKYIVQNSKTDPLAQKFKTKVRALFQLVEVQDDGSYGDVKVWDRGPNHITQLLTLMETIGPLNTFSITIIRNGAKRSTQTTYQMITGRETIDPVATKLPVAEDLTASGRYIINMTHEDMVKVANGTYFLKAFEKKDSANPAVVERTNNTESNPFEGNSTVKPVEKAKPPMPVWNPVTESYDVVSAPVVEPVTPVKPPAPQMVGDVWHVPVLNKTTNLWEYPTMKPDVGLTSGKVIKPEDKF